MTIPRKIISIVLGIGRTVVSSVASSILATDFGGGVCPALFKTSNGFSRALVRDIRVGSEPPKATIQGSTRILKKRNGQLFVGKPLNSNAIKAKAYLKSLLKPYCPFIPYQNPISVDVRYEFAFNKTEKKLNINKGKIPHSKRPDSDNLMKGLFDVMTELGFWKDDSQLCEIKFAKSYSQYPLIAIKIYELI